MNAPKEPRKEETLPELETKATALAKTDKHLTDQIDKLTKERNEVRKNRRAVEGKITTARINQKA
jgi:hypothetical protein